MTCLEFTIAGLEPSPYGFAMLVLNRVPLTHTLHVRLGTVDAQPLASELAGVATVRSRLALAVRQFVELLDGHMAHVWLRRGAGSLIEAQMIVETSLEQITVPLTCGDALALALAHDLPIYGDLTLSSLMQEVAQQEPEKVDLPSGIETFLSSL